MATNGYFERLASTVAPVLTAGNRRHNSATRDPRSTPGCGKLAPSSAALVLVWAEVPGARVRVGEKPDIEGLGAFVLPLTASTLARGKIAARCWSHCRSLSLAIAWASMRRTVRQEAVCLSDMALLIMSSVLALFPTKESRLTLASPDSFLVPLNLLPEAATPDSPLSLPRSTPHPTNIESQQESNCLLGMNSTLLQARKMAVYEHVNYSRDPTAPPKPPPPSPAGDD
ncbi:hypothetical protein FH972_024459 [Carpinus fangiana]|uniref:Uncharacterized protein n=1 Tax=Carpinus fangiana TaxID=176857 RepID=A0A5N6KYT7_9ROSI|nr:hypothetical protein FH972_024459 [Carpinus fangiana]